MDDDRTKDAADREDARRVRDDSDELMTALDDLKAMEQRKRFQDISTPPFHQLADDIEDQSRHVFEVAARQTHDGERVPTSDVSISEVAPSEAPRRSAERREAHHPE